MEFLLTHWHCILPLAAVIIGAVFMKNKKQNEEE
jgi:hypothetical protein